MPADGVRRMRECSQRHGFVFGVEQKRSDHDIQKTLRPPGRIPSWYCGIASTRQRQPPLATTVTQFSPASDNVVTRGHESLPVNLPVPKIEGITAMEGSQQSVAARRPTRCRKARSSLVRRLVQARDDPEKERIRRWLSDINDERLLNFGLTPEDIALLRGSGGLVNSLRMGASSLLSIPSPPGSWF
jgi:hypothetical protein